MPDQPSWIQRVPTILAALDHDGGPALLDRSAVERVMGLSPRQANRLMRECADSYSVGRSVVVPRASLASVVRQQLDSGAVIRETRRRERLGENLADARREALVRRILIPVTAGVRERKLEDLPPGIVLEPGLLKIDFQTPLELIEKLFELSQALCNDFSAFEKLASSD